MRLNTFKFPASDRPRPPAVLRKRPPKNAKYNGINSKVGESLWIRKQILACTHHII